MARSRKFGRFNPNWGFLFILGHFEINMASPHRYLNSQKDTLAYRYSADLRYTSTNINVPANVTLVFMLKIHVETSKMCLMNSS